MKKLRWIIALCMTMMVMSVWAQYDDMYFTPKKKAKKETVKEQTIGESYSEDHAEVVYSDNQRNVDEYNRRYTSDVEAYDSTEVDNEVPAEEYEYSKRILRFSTPSVGIPVSSPLYWDLCYGPASIYWDVYDDGVYAYVSPSTWNNWYYGWGWSSFYPYWGWRDPWHYGWYDPWYCGYGYYNPYYYPYYGHHHHYPHYAPSHRPGGGGKPAYRPSTQYRERSSLARGDRNTNNRSNRTTVTSRDNTQRRTSSTATRNNSTSSNRNSTPVRSSSGRSSSTPTRSSSYSSGSNYNSGSSRSTYSSPSYSSPSRSGGFSPSRGGGGGSRGGRR